MDPVRCTEEESLQLHYTTLYTMTNKYTGLCQITRLISWRLWTQLAAPPPDTIIRQSLEKPVFATGVILSAYVALSDVCTAIDESRDICHLCGESR